MKQIVLWLTTLVLLVSCLCCPVSAVETGAMRYEIDSDTGEKRYTEIQIETAWGQWEWIPIYDEAGQAKWSYICNEEGDYEWVPAEEAPTQEEVALQLRARKAAVEKRFGVVVVEETPERPLDMQLCQIIHLEKAIETIPAALYEKARIALAAKGKTLTIRLGREDDLSASWITAGQYSPHSTTIHLYDVDPEVFAHEYAHLLHLTLLNSVYSAAEIEARWTALNQGAVYGSAFSENTFITPYAATAFEEDFADSVAYLLARPEMVQELSLHCPDAPVIRKIQYVRQLLSDTFGVPLSQFPDITLSQPSSWAGDGVSDYRTLFPSGVFTSLGTPFHPGYQSGATRQDFAAAAYELAEAVWAQRQDSWEELYPQYPMDQMHQHNPFTDVTSRINAREAIVKLFLMGVVTGKSTDSFDPEGTITRQEAAVMLYRLCQVLELSLPQVEETPEIRDSAQCAAWALESVRGMYSAGIMTGVGDGRFAPTGIYSNEQSLLTMVRIYHLFPESA